MRPEKKNRIQGILSVIGGMLIHFTFGHFYTVANMVPYIMGYTKTRVDKDIKSEYSVWLSALALGIQGFSMPLGGIIARRFGFRWVVAISCLLESGGVLATYFTIQYSFVGVIITYSLIKGGGLGFGYSVVIAVATSWFPGRRGLVVGLIVAGFGLGSFVFTPVQTAFINPNNVAVNETTKQFTDKDVLDRLPKAFLMLGGILLGLQIIGMCLLRQKPNPVEDFEGASDRTEKKSAPSEIQNHGVDEDKTPYTTDEVESTTPFTKIVHRKEDTLDLSEAPIENLGPKQALRCLDFYLLWIVMFCNVIPIAIITSAFKYFGQRHISDDWFLSIVATTSSVCNSAGRICWGALVDKISFKIPLFIMLTLWAFVLVTFPHLAHAGPTALRVLYFIWVCLLWISLSGVFAIMPAATGTLFGQASLAINYGMIFSAFAAGSLLCGLFVTFFPSKDAYLAQFTGCACVCVAALFAVMWIQDRKMNPKVNICRWCTTQCMSLRGHTATIDHSQVELATRNA